MGFANKLSPTLASHQTAQKTRELPPDAAKLQFPVHINQMSIVSQTCASSFFMHQAGERLCDAKAGIRCSSSQTIVCWCNTAANQVKMVHPTEDLPLRNKSCLEAGTGDLVMNDKQQHNRSLHDECRID